MRVEINGIDYEIIEVESESEKLKIEEKECLGTCRYVEQKIYICKDMTIGRKKQTLIHELVHAFIYEYLLKIQDSYDNEDVCEFVSRYGERILGIARKYIETKYKYTKGC